MCVATRACGGDPVGRWNIVSMCTRAPEITFAAYTMIPGARCKAQVQAADVTAEGQLSISEQLALSMDYRLESSLKLDWAVRCLTSDESDCQEVVGALRSQPGVQRVDCARRDEACSCQLQVRVHVQAQDLDGARELFDAGQQCVSGQRMSLDDASATLLLERAAP